MAKAKQASLRITRSRAVSRVRIQTNPLTLLNSEKRSADELNNALYLGISIAGATVRRMKMALPTAGSVDNSLRAVAT